MSIGWISISPLDEFCFWANKKQWSWQQLKTAFGEWQAINCHCQTWLTKHPSETEIRKRWSVFCVINVQNLEKNNLNVPIVPSRSTLFHLWDEIEIYADVSVTARCSVLVNESGLVGTWLRQNWFLWHVSPLLSSLVLHYCLLSYEVCPKDCHKSEQQVKNNEGIFWSFICF